MKTYIILIPYIYGECICEFSYSYFDCKVYKSYEVYSCYIVFDKNISIIASTDINIDNCAFFAKKWIDDYININSLVGLIPKRYIPQNKNIISDFCHNVNDKIWNNIYPKDHDLFKKDRISLSSALALGILTFDEIIKNQIPIFYKNLNKNISFPDIGSEEGKCIIEPIKFSINSTIEVKKKSDKISSYHRNGLIKIVFTPFITNETESISLIETNSDYTTEYDISILRKKDNSYEVAISKDSDDSNLETYKSTYVSYESFKKYSNFLKQFPFNFIDSKREMLAHILCNLISLSNKEITNILKKPIFKYFFANLNTYTSSLDTLFIHKNCDNMEIAHFINIAEYAEKNYSNIEIPFFDIKIAISEKEKTNSHLDEINTILLKETSSSLFKELKFILEKHYSEIPESILIRIEKWCWSYFLTIEKHNFLAKIALFCINNKFNNNTTTSDDALFNAYFPSQDELDKHNKSENTLKIREEKLEKITNRGAIISRWRRLCRDLAHKENFPIILLGKSPRGKK